MTDDKKDDIENENLSEPVGDEDNTQSDDQPKPTEDVFSSDQPAKTAAGLKVIMPIEKKVAADEPAIDQATKSVADEPDDVMPDMAQKMADNSTNNMQSPKLFDTKEYHLPISQSVHSHGFLLGSIIAGIIFAVLAAGLALFVLNKIG